MSTKQSIILDVDTGIDDALAILYLLRHPDVKVEGITTGFGNVDAELATLNTLKMVELAGKAGEIPVAKGAGSPLFRKWGGPVPHIHGKNGIGEVKLPQPAQKEFEETAADFIVRTVNEKVGEVTLVCVGRLTNLAIALAKDVTLPKKVKKLVIMGGTLRAPGNVTPVSEANIIGDPEAAHMVFEAGFPLTMVGLDVTMEAPITPADVEGLLQRADDEHRPLIQELSDMLDFRFRAYDETDGFSVGCPLHDPLAAAVAVDPTLVETEEHYIRIETKGQLSAGATLADLRARPKERTNTSVCVKVDSERFISHFCHVLLGTVEEGAQ